MKNILVLNYEFPPLGGGASPVSYEIAKRYVKKGFKVDVVTMGYKGLPDVEILEGIHIYRVRCLRKRKETCETYEMISYVISAITFLYNRLKKMNYTICHCHFLIPTGIVALYLKRKYKLDYIVTIHGSDIPGYNSDRFRFEHHFTKPLLKKIGKNAKVICSPSLFLKNLTIRQLGGLSIIHIPNGIDQKEFEPLTSKIKEKIILSTGRLVERKGFQTLIRAVREVELPYEVHIAGDGPYREQLVSLAEGSKTKIVFHGWLEQGSGQLKDLYEKASIYMLVSSKENASTALLEGMAARCAVVTSNDSGCLETVGDAGLLVKYNDHVRLKEILIELCANDKMIEEYAQKAHNRVIEYFQWDKSIDKYISLFD